MKISFYREWEYNLSNERTSTCPHARQKHVLLANQIQSFDNQTSKFTRSLGNVLAPLKPGFHIIAPVATVVAIVEKRVLTQKYFLSDASDTVFPYDRRCRSISLKLGRGDLGSITNFCARIWRYFQNAGRCERRNRRNRLEFLQIPPVTSPDIFKFCLRISGTHVKLFASSSS